jgi:hypothetical protein
MCRNCDSVTTALQKANFTNQAGSGPVMRGAEGRSVGCRTLKETNKNLNIKLLKGILVLLSYSLQSAFCSYSN